MMAVLVTLLALASVWDVALHRIPNTVVIGVLATGALANLFHGGVAAVGLGALAVALTAVALWPAWTRHWIGGGDLKLGAATAAWLGVARVPAYLVGSAVTVGVLSVLCYFASGRDARAEVRRNLVYAANGIAVAPPTTAERGRVQVPAGAAFAIAALILLTMTGGL